MDYMHFTYDSGYPLEPWLLTCIGTIADSSQGGIQQGTHQDKKHDRTVCWGTQVTILIFRQDWRYTITCKTVC